MFKLKRVVIHKSPNPKSKEDKNQEESHDFHQKWIERAMTSPSNVIQSNGEPPRPGLIKVQKPVHISNSTTENNGTSSGGGGVPRVVGASKPNRPKPVKKRHRRKHRSLEEKELMEKRKLQKAPEKKKPPQPRTKQQQLLSTPPPSELSALSKSDYLITLPTRNQFLKKLSSTLIEIPENGYVNDTNCKNHKVITQPTQTLKPQPIKSNDARKLNREKLQRGSISLDDIMDDDNDNDDNLYIPNSEADEHEETKECELDYQHQSHLQSKINNNKIKKRPSRLGRENNGLGDIYMSSSSSRKHNDEQKLIRGTSMDSLIQSLNYTSTNNQTSAIHSSSKAKPILQMRKEQDHVQLQKKGPIRGISLDEILDNSNHSQEIGGRNSPDTVLDFDQSFDETYSPNKAYNRLAILSSSSPYKSSLDQSDKMRRGTSMDSVFIPNAIVSLGGSIPLACSQMSEKARLENHKSQRVGYTV